MVFFCDDDTQWLIRTVKVMDSTSDHGAVSALFGRRSFLKGKNYFQTNVRILEPSY
eukprot:m.274483 g.274483  ORF g.274483 m.274483 type:complete len:56 (+) comp69689_c0_seq1:216-383(+)